MEDSMYNYIVKLENLLNIVIEKLRKKSETMVQLVQPVVSLTRERDELKNQLQFILSKIKQPPANMTNISTVDSKFFHCSPQLKKHAIALSPITESDNLSMSLNHVSYGASAADQKCFHIVQSPELLSFKVDSYQQPKLKESKIISASDSAKFDQLSVVIDSFAMKKLCQRMASLCNLF